MNISKLRGVMAEQGMNVTELASKIASTRSTLHRKLSGKAKFSVEEAGKIKEVLHLTDEKASAIFFE